MNAAYTPQATNNTTDETRANLVEVALDDTKQETYENEHGGKQSRIGVDMTLLPLDGLLKAAAIMTSNNDTHGGKYPRNNWRSISLRDHISHAYLHVAKAGHLLDQAEYARKMNDPEMAEYYEAKAIQEMSHASCRALFSTSELYV